MKIIGLQIIWFLMKYLKLFIFLGYTNAGIKYSWSDYLDL